MQVLLIPPELEAREKEIVSRHLKEAGLELLFDTSRVTESTWSVRERNEYLEPDRIKYYVIEVEGKGYAVKVGDSWTRVLGPKPALSWYQFPRVIGVVTDLKTAKTALAHAALHGTLVISRIPGDGIGPLDKSAGRLLEERLSGVFKAAQPEVRVLYRLLAQP